MIIAKKCKVLKILVLCQILTSCITNRSNRSPRFISLKNDFLKSIDRETSKLDSKFFQRHKRIYDNFVYRKVAKDENKKALRQRRLDDYLAKDKNNLQKVISSFRKLEAIAPIHIERFKERFPTGNYDYEIYVLPTLLWFPGRAGFSDNKVVVAFGADTISKNNESLPVLFAHEMFHAFQFKTLNWTEKEYEKSETMIGLLWQEGLASYVSAIINNLPPTPNATFGKIGKLCSEDKKHIGARLIVDLKENKFSRDEKLLNLWFGSGDEKLNIPPMAGYCVGMWAVEEALKTSSLEKLVAWDMLNNENKIMDYVQRINFD